jgi:hypothetical protein
MSVDYLQRAAAYFEPRENHDAQALMLAAGLNPDPWQSDLMRERPDRALLLCSRQAGKSMAVAAIALDQALSHPGTTTLLVSPSQRQSAELLGKVRSLAMAQRKRVGLERLSVLSMQLDSGSRIVSLPGKAEVIRGYTADVLVLDEAAWIPDTLYESVRPMLAVSGGRLLALSTPFGRRGWFHAAWTGSEAWHRTRVTAYQVPRISAEFLEEERRSLPATVFAAEYECQFSDTLESVFGNEDVRAAMSDDIEPLFGPHSGKAPTESVAVPLFAGGVVS